MVNTINITILFVITSIDIIIVTITMLVFIVTAIIREELVEFEAGLKRGKVFVPVLTKEEQEQERRKAEIAEKVK